MVRFIGHEYIQTFLLMSDWFEAQTMTQNNLSNQLCHVILTLSLTVLKQTILYLT